MRATILIILLLAIPTVPVAIAKSIGFVPLHVGDRLLYESSAEEVVTAPDGTDDTARGGRLPWTGTMDTLVTVEGRATATDEFGVPRETAAFHIERAVDDVVVSDERCYMEPGMGWALRWDYIRGGPGTVDEWQYRGNDPVFGSPTRTYNRTPAIDFRASACDGYWDPPGLFGPDIEPGEKADIRDLSDGFQTIPSFFHAEMSLPARAARWHDWAAVEYEFPLRGVDCSVAACAGDPGTLEGTLVLTFAQGFPGVVRAEIDQTEYDADGTKRAQRGTIELTGYEPGTEPFPYDIPWRDNPEESPTARFVELGPLELPDAALDLEYPFSIALANLRADPALDLDAFLRANPDAAVKRAEYDADMERETGGLERALGNTLPVNTRGPGWRVCVADSTAEHCYQTMITRGEMTRAPANRKDGDYGGSAIPPMPMRVISPDDILGALTLTGVSVSDIRALEYEVGGTEGFVSVRLLVSEVSWTTLAETQGRQVWIDLMTGAILDASAIAVTFSTEGDLLSAATPPRGLQPAATETAWSSIRLTGPLQATAALTGLALLALAIKLVLLPLYTRLVRDRLLDNPVRARLYDRIRAEPGIHLAELEEFLGVGKGATKHHVDQLARHKFVFVLDESGKSRCYAAGHIPVEVARRHALLRAGSNQRVYDLLRAEPALSLRAAAERLGMSAPSVHRAKKRLQKEGLLGR